VVNNFEYPLVSTVSLNFTSYMLALGSLGRVRIHFYHSGVLGFQPVNITAQFYANPEHPAPNVSPGERGLANGLLGRRFGYISHWKSPPEIACSCLPMA
jgi:hypothetical protein